MLRESLQLSNVVLVVLASRHLERAFVVGPLTRLSILSAVVGFAAVTTISLILSALFDA